MNEITLSQLRKDLRTKGEAPPGNACAICASKHDLMAYGHRAASTKVKTLCRSCNIGLEAFCDNPSLLAKAISFLLDLHECANMTTARMHVVEEEDTNV